MADSAALIVSALVGLFGGGTGVAVLAMRRESAKTWAGTARELREDSNEMWDRLQGAWAELDTQRDRRMVLSDRVAELEQELLTQAKLVAEAFEVIADLLDVMEAAGLDLSKLNGRLAKWKRSKT